MGKEMPGSSAPALAPGLTTAKRTGRYTTLKPSAGAAERYRHHSSRCVSGVSHLRFFEWIALTKCNGVDIVKKNAARKAKLLMAFPGVFYVSPEASPSHSGPPATPDQASRPSSAVQAVDVGRLGVLRNLESHQPTLYLEFPQGRLKMEGEVLFPKTNRFVTLQFPSNAKSVVCQDVFDRVVTFPRVYWVGNALENPEETPLPLPPEITIATAPLASMPWGPRVCLRPEEEHAAESDEETTAASAEEAMQTPNQKQRSGQRRVSDNWDSSEGVSEEEGEDDEEEEGYYEVTPSRTPSQTPTQRSTPARAASQRARRQLLDVMAFNSVGSESSDLEILDEQPAVADDLVEEPDDEKAPSPQRSSYCTSDVTPSRETRSRRRTPESAKVTNTTRKRSRAPDDDVISIESDETVTTTPTPSRSKRRSTPQTTTPVVTPVRQRTPTRTKMAITKLLSSGRTSVDHSEDDSDSLVNAVLATPSRRRQEQTTSSTARRRSKRRSTTPIPTPAPSSDATSRSSARKATRRTPQRSRSSSESKAKHAIIWVDSD